MIVPVNEQETTISYARDSKEVDIWTSDTTVMTKLDKLCESDDNYVLKSTEKAKIGGEIIAKVYKIADKKLLSFRRKKEGKKLSDEQKQVMADRLKAAREKRAKES